MLMLVPTMTITMNGVISDRVTSMHSIIYQPTHRRSRFTLRKTADLQRQLVQTRTSVKRIITTQLPQTILITAWTIPLMSVSSVFLNATVDNKYSGEDDSNQAAEE